MRRWILSAPIALWLAASVAGAGIAFAATLAINSQKLTATATATSVSCVAQVNMIDGNEFDPMTVTITPGCSIRWTNTAGPTHTTTSNSSTGNTTDPWDSGNLSTGQTFTKVFNSTGTFDYICTLHKKLTATVIVNP